MRSGLGLGVGLGLGLGFLESTPTVQLTSKYSDP